MKFDSIYCKIIENYIENVVEVYIDGVGHVIAEADTGNSGYNVLHGFIEKINGNVATVRTINNRTLERPIVEFITAVTGSSNEEKRPVILLDIQVNGMPHSKIPFSISDRSSNTAKILLGKPFLKEITNFVKL